MVDFEVEGIVSEMEVKTVSKKLTYSEVFIPQSVGDGKGKSRRR